MSPQTCCKRSVLLAAMLGAGCVSKAYVPPPVVPGNVDALGALSKLQENVSAVTCGANMTSGGFGALQHVQPTRAVATGSALTLGCTTKTFTLRYRELPHAYLGSDNRHSMEPYYYICSGPAQGACEWKIYVRNGPGVNEFVAAWAALGQRPGAAEPADDAAFQDALRSGAAPDTEMLRRAQVQAETALRDQQLVRAARIYRDALARSPAWAPGHFNLALVYGELQLYTEAITAMRRYLYLSPKASDARAARDKIYEWEALEPT
jgi:hypothetical protein